MILNKKELLNGSIYTGFYLARIVQGLVPDNIKDEIFTIVNDNLNVMGAEVDLSELKLLDKISLNESISIIRNIKSKTFNAIYNACGPQIADWFELTFSLSILDETPEAISDFDQQLIELASRVGYPKQDFHNIIAGFRSPNAKKFLEIFIKNSLEIVGYKYIFISHATKDHELAEEFAKLFEKEKIKSFVANIDILPGSDWCEQLREKLYKSDELLLILSPESIKSEWVMIEVGAAWALNKIITPAVLYVDITSAPEPIKRFQAYNITTISAKKKLVENIANRIYNRSR